MSAPYEVGAWQIKHDALGYPSIYGTDEDGNPGDLVAHTFGGHERRISAAPDLLAALEKSAVALDEAAKLLTAKGLAGCGSIMAGHADIARAAILKAEGDGEAGGVL